MITESLFQPKVFFHKTLIIFPLKIPLFQALTFWAVVKNILALRPLNEASIVPKK
jgi:hypothetical protein